MKICLISREYPPETHFGGTGTYTFNISKALARKGHEVHVITETAGRPVRRSEEGVVIHYLPSAGLRPRELNYLARSFRVARHVLTLNRKFDIVQAVEWNAEAALLSLVAGAKLITRLATPLYLVERLESQGWQLRKAGLVKWLERMQTKRSAGIISSSQSLAKVVSGDWEIPLSRIRVIPNSIDMKRMMGFRAARATRVDSNQDYLVYFGRLEVRKGVHILARALPAIFRQYPNLSVVFVGEDGGFGSIDMRHYIEGLNRKWADKLHFIDRLPQEELFPIVAGAKLVVLPSLWEAFGFVAIEAMSLGRAVVATKGSGFAEIIEHGRSGFLVQPGSEPALIEGILTGLRNDSLLKDVEEQASIRAWDFHVDHVVGQLEAFYAEIIGQKRVRGFRFREIASPLRLGRHP